MTKHEVTALTISLCVVGIGQASCVDISVSSPRLFPVVTSFDESTWSSDELRDAERISRHLIAACQTTAAKALDLHSINHADNSSVSRISSVMTVHHVSICSRRNVEADDVATGLEDISPTQCHHHQRQSARYQMQMELHQFQLAEDCPPEKHHYPTRTEMSDPSTFTLLTCTMKGFDLGDF